MHLPLAVAAAVGGETDGVLKLAAASLVFEVGVRTLDRALPPPPIDRWPAGAVLLSTTSLATYAPAEVARRASLRPGDAFYPAASALHAPVIDRPSAGARGGFGAAGAASCDVRRSDADRTRKDWSAARVVRLDGRAAELAGADPAVCRLYGEYACCVALARKVRELDVGAPSQRWRARQTYCENAPAHGRWPSGRRAPQSSSRPPFTRPE